MTEAEFGLLGPLIVRTGGERVLVPHGHQQTVLTLLLLEANRVVSMDRIAEVLWGAAPPPAAEVTVRNLIRRLRQTLGDTDKSRVSARRRGYLLRVSAGELDLAEFEALAQSAREAAHGECWERAAGQARAALALWRGEPLAEVDSDTLQRREAPRLTEMRWEILETRIDADLHRGQHRELVAELQGLAGAHPLREQAHAFLMLALYRCGRQGEALAAYQQARAVLAHELGTEPGTGLQRLHQQILTADPALAAPEPPGSRSSMPSSGSPGAARQADQNPFVVPRQLPCSVAFFTGRAAELAWLSDSLDDTSDHAAGTVVVSAIGGTAGVGKTALAVHWAHQVADRFPDGQLYVNLRGFSPSATPVTPAEAVRGFLDALGVSAEQVPRDSAAQAGLYRSLLAGRRVLILLDNAIDEQQVRPLLPGTTGCLVLATSRHQLAGLAATEGAQLMSLDLLTAADSRSLLTARLGAGRAAAEPDAVDEITRLCARLPLALAIAAARAAARPTVPLAALADELRESGTRLDALDAGDPATSVRAVFSWSTRQLAPPAAGMFRLLGLHPGPDITLHAAASLAATDLARAQRALAQLRRAHLITEHSRGRYAFHDLLRAYAGELARATLSAADRHQATGRLLDYYLHTAVAAARLLNRAPEPVAIAPPRAGAVQWQPADSRQAMAWFEDEHRVLLALITLAAGSGFDTHTWQLAWATSPFLQTHGHNQDWAAIQGTGLTAATRLGDAAARALSGRLLAMACVELGELELALDHFATSLTLCQHLGDRLGEAKIHHCLGVIAERQGRHADALKCAEHALRLYQAIGDKASQVVGFNNISMAHNHLGDYEQARTFARQALILSEEIGHGWLIGFAVDSLGCAEHHLGNFARAKACFQRSLILCREAGERFAEATTLTHLAESYQATFDYPQAQDAWLKALAILDDLHHPDAEGVRVRLARS